MANFFNNIFGFKFVKKEEKQGEQKELSFVPPFDPSEAKALVAGRFINTLYSYGMNDNFTQEEIIKKYREMAMAPEIESAIDEITNEIFYIGDNETPVNIVLDQIDYNDTIKQKIAKEFEEILTILNFKETMYEYFKRWYIDGAIYFNVVIDMNNPSAGIKDLRYIDALKMKKVIEVLSEKRVGGGILPIPDEYEEYYIYDNILKIPVDSIIASTSGITKTLDDGKTTINLSYLHKSIKPYNQLNMLEDAAVIYKISRAPERRVFKIPVPNGPRHKQEEYINELIRKFKNKLAYDPTTGELKDTTRVLSILEDFWIPVPEGGTGADVSTLPGGQNLGDANIENYFKNKLYKSLYVPLSRFGDVAEGGGQASYSARATEIIREEIKFAKFIQRLRNRFSKIFTQALKIQLILKNIVDLDEWENNLKNKIYYDFKKDSHFFEFNEAEVITRRIELATAALQLEGYFSKRYIQTKFLKLTDEEIKEIEMDNQGKKKGEPEPSGFGGGFNRPFGSEPTGIEPLEEPEFNITQELPNEEEPIGGGVEELPAPENIENHEEKPPTEKI